MKTGTAGVKALLAKYTGVQLGDEESDTGCLRADLMALARHNERSFWVCETFIVLLFVIALAMVVRFSGSPERIIGVFAATGISILGIVNRMMHLWRTKVSLELLTVLASSLDPEGVRGVFAILKKEL